MISHNQPHTYKDQGRKFYAFFENYEWILDEKIIKGFHFYIFDQEGFCWDSCTNPSRKYIKDKSYGFFLDRPAWEADGLPFRLPLKGRCLTLPSIYASGPSGNARAKGQKRFDKCITITEQDLNDLIKLERNAQDAKWGPQHHVDSKWASIAGEEMGEIHSAMNENAPDSELLNEIVQLAAVLQAWVTSKDWFYDGDTEETPHASHTD